jgi:predicted ATP-grasp superfamily ATP-dependent carboligase
VLGGDHRGLGVARSLGRRGIPVWIVGESADRVAGSSRYCLRRMHWPDSELAGRIEFLLELRERAGLDGWVLFVAHDDVAELVARNAERLSGFLLTTDSARVLERAADKRLAYQLAGEAGIPCPRTVYPRSRDDLESIEIAFPAILKPTIKESVNKFTYDKAWPARDRRELIALYDAATALVAPETIMVQELLPGGGEVQFSFGALCHQGRPIASVTARRLRQYPLDFGHSSSCVETIDEPEVAHHAQSLLAALDYSGLVEVEFMRDVRDGSLRLLDVNARLWTWHSLAQRAGVDLPYLQWRLVRGEPVSPCQTIAGVRWIRPATDVVACAQLLAARRERALALLRTYRRPVELAPFAADDPMPALLEMPVNFANGVMRFLNPSLRNRRSNRGAERELAHRAS